MMQTQLDPGIFGTLRASLPTSSLSEIYSAFLTDTRKRIAELTDALGNPGASDVAARIAHAIRGSSGMIGACMVAAVAEDLGLHPDRLDDRHISDLLNACHRLESKLRAEGLAL